MKSMFFRTAALAAALVMGAAAGFAEDNSTDGKTIFQDNCAQCHGDGGHPTEFGLQLQPYPARDLAALAAYADRDELRRIITYGVHDTAMTAKKYALDDLQIEAVIDFIQSLNYTPNLANGKKRFLEVCSTCHGKDARAQTGLGAKNLVYTSLDLNGIVHTMRYGRANTLMTSKRHQLTNPEIADIANYVFSLRRNGDATRGGKHYAKSCTQCHKTPSDITLVGNAALKRTVKNLDDRQLDLRIRHGRHIDRAGKSVARLSADDVQDIIAFIRQETK